MTEFIRHSVFEIYACCSTWQNLLSINWTYYTMNLGVDRLVLLPHISYCEDQSRAANYDNYTFSFPRSHQTMFMQFYIPVQGLWVCYLQASLTDRQKEKAFTSCLNFHTASV